MSGPPLNLEETLAMAESMAERAEKHADEESPGRDDSYWDGWADGLRTLLTHQRTGVKVTCFPVGSCACHPFKIERPIPPEPVGHYLRRVLHLPHRNLP